MNNICLFLSLLGLLVGLVKSELINFEELGAIPHLSSYDVALHNGNLFNKTINSLTPGSIFYIPRKTFSLSGGMKARDLKNVTFLIDGEIKFDNNRETWPVNSSGHVEECIYLENLENVIFTSNNKDKGVINGNGLPWWGAIKFLKHQEDRPRLVHIKISKNIIFENLLLKDSPFWTFYAEKSDGLIIRHSAADARITNFHNHTLIDLNAFNTDGFDVTGRNVHIHDCDIWVQDDCICAKDDSQDMLFERINCSGLGLVVGSIGNSQVRNITFRDSYMDNTVKGIYMKTRWNDSSPIGYNASITDVLYSNITIESPLQYGIWMGPAQQSDQPCSLLWNITPRAECPMSGYQIWENIVLKDIFINNPKNSPGMLMGNVTFPMRNIVFDNVVVTNPGSEPWGDDFYYCQGIEGYAVGNTWPVPPCFKKVESIDDLPQK